MIKIINSTSEKVLYEIYFRLRKFQDKGSNLLLTKYLFPFPTLKKGRYPYLKHLTPLLSRSEP